MQDNQNEKPEKQIARNEPCPCGSGKKYKRCCGADAAPKLSQPSANPMNDTAREQLKAQAAQMGVDPSQLSPEWISQFQRQLGRLPKGQVQRLQGLMKKAMSGKDISREAAELDGFLPPEFQQFLVNSPFGAGLAGSQAAPTPETANADLSLEEAKRIVEEAAQKGQISKDEAAKLVENAPTENKGFFSKFRRK